MLHHPIDAIFTRIWVGNSHRHHPADAAAGAALDGQLLRARGLWRRAAADPVSARSRRPRQHPHPRVPAEDRRLASASRSCCGRCSSISSTCWRCWLRARPTTTACSMSTCTTWRTTARSTRRRTAPLDRTSFLDFSRHAFKQGLDLVSGVSIFRYLRAKGKTRQISDLLRGLAIWWAIAHRRRHLQSRWRRHPVHLALLRRQHAVAGRLLAARPGRSARASARGTRQLHRLRRPRARQSRQRLSRRAPRAARPALGAYYEDYSKAGQRRERAPGGGDAEGDVQPAHLRRRAVAQGLCRHRQLRPPRGRAGGRHKELARDRPRSARGRSTTAPHAPALPHASTTPSAG